MGENVFQSYVSQRVNKIRWKPELMENTQYFVTGSIDEEDNNVTLWWHPYEHSELDDVPCRLATLPHKGDVTALEFVDTDTAVCSSSHGHVQLLKVRGEEISSEHTWGRLHTGGGATALTCFDEDIASVGEDGNLVLLTAGNRAPVRVIEKADSCPIMCVAFLKHNELVSGNLRGQLKMWDLTASDDRPVTSFMTAGDGGAGGSTCVTSHPTQRHLMLAGGHDGGITLWDLRHSTYPLNVLNAHTAPVSEMKLNAERPEHLVTCCWAGELWQWNSAWLGPDASKQRMEITSLMPSPGKSINSIDINRTRVLAACDNEAIYLINNGF